jgi:preprotein translocase SecE subunit
VSFMKIVNKRNNESTAESGKKNKQTLPEPNKSYHWLEYLRGVRTEWGKISWPTWPQIWGQTIVVLVMVTIMSVGLWVIDSLFRILISFVVPAK